MTLDEVPLASARPLEDVEGKPIDELSAVDERAIMADTIDRVANVVVTVVPLALSAWQPGLRGAAPCAGPTWSCWRSPTC